jgi:hypothetical protein
MSPDMPAMNHASAWPCLTALMTLVTPRCLHVSKITIGTAIRK